MAEPETYDGPLRELSEAACADVAKESATCDYPECHALLVRLLATGAAKLRMDVEGLAAVGLVGGGCVRAGSRGLRRWATGFRPVGACWWLAGFGGGLAGSVRARRSRRTVLHRNETSPTKGWTMARPRRSAIALRAFVAQLASAMGAFAE